MTVANQNLIQEEIKSQLNSGSAYYPSVGELGTTLAVTSNRHTDSSHRDEGGAKFLWNVGSYKSHTA
jgi:hypothetical protein